MTANELARRVKAKRVGRSFVCRCPAHNDGDPSLSIMQGHTAILLKCFAGCEPADIIAAWKASGVWEEAPKRRQPRGVTS
jgi:putative DNA primase/helicase